jgi:dihydropteroate synthase
MSKLVGILNITPDSFSDGGNTQTVQAIAHTQKLIADGATIIDIGAESTRPGATPLSHEEEWIRLDGILQEVIELCHANKVFTSLDTRHPESAKKAISLGIDWINDVDGFNNPEMISAVKDSTASIVFMHSLGVPANKNKTLPEDVDPINYITDWANHKIKNLTENGISIDRLIFDPGIGFGKTTAQSWEILENIEEFKQLGTKILVGHSRKSFLNLLSGGQTVEENDLKTIAVSITLAAKEIDYLRVHDVAGHTTVLNEGIRL